MTIRSRQSISLLVACLAVLAGTNGISLAADTARPTAPGNLTAMAPEPTQINLSWIASTDLGGGVVAGYDI